MNNYCWLFAKIGKPPKDDEHPGPCSTVKGPKTVEYLHNAHYQWIPFFLIICAGTCFIPRRLWYFFDAGYFMSILEGVDISNADSVAQVMMSLSVNYLNVFSFIAISPRTGNSEHSTQRRLFLLLHVVLRTQLCRALGIVCCQQPFCGW